jgi:uncharacterized membrane protein YdbT with pleckstrin-like domain
MRRFRKSFMIELHPNESIRLIVRKHWFVLVTKLLPLFFALFLPLILFFLIRFVVENASEEVARGIEGALSGELIVFLSLLWVFFIWIWGFVVWTDYYLDVWIVTNKRVFDVEQKGFFKRDVSIFRMDRVQDIKTHVAGIIPTLLNFGEIHVQTAGSDREFVMHGAPAPAQLKQAISTLQDRIHDSASHKEQGL